MHLKRLLQIFILTILLMTAIVACGGDEDEPVPTAVPPATIPETSEVVKPTSQPTAQPTAAPQTQAVDPADIDWPPQLVYSDPAIGEEVTLDGDITLRFDQPMDQASVEKSLAVESVPDETAVSGTTTWPRPDTVIFTPDKQLSREQQYRVRVGKEAAGLNGQAMSQPAEFNLQSVGYLEATQVIPANGTRDVDTDTPITVLFNRPVVPLVTSDNQASLPQPLTINPPLVGTGEWTSTSIYRFIPDEAMDGATRYQVTVNAGLESVDGAVVAEDVNWGFATFAPQVVQILLPLAEYQEQTTPIAPTSSITITFNMPMDRASTENAISVRGVDAPTASLDYKWSDEDRVVSITPDPMLALDTAYQVVVDTSAQAAASPTNLAEEAIKPFSTAPYPAVIETNPSDGALAESWNSGFNVVFASPMNIDTLEDKVLIEPAPNRVNYYFDTWSGFQMSVNFTPERNTTYRITIPATAADPYGNTLGADYTFSYDTADYAAIASFNLPGTSSQLSTSFESVVDVIYRNVSQIDVGLYDVGLPVRLLNNSYDLAEYSPDTDPLRSWQIQPESEGTSTRISLAEGDTLPTGVYFLEVDAPELGDDSRYWQINKALLIVADTNLVIKQMPNEVRVWATDIASGKPAPGRNLTLYTDDGIAQGTAVTDADGFAKFDYSPERDGSSGVTVVSNEPGQAGFGAAGSTWTGGINYWQMGLNVGYFDSDRLFAYIYTDRPIYRPGDTIHYKAIMRDPDFGRYDLPSYDEATLRITPTYYSEEGGIDETIPVTLDADGVFYGDFEIPKDAPLGDIQFFIEGLDWQGNRRVTIAEYRKPEFLITMQPDKEEARRGEAVNVVVDAQYFSGGAVTDVPVNWTLYEDTFYPDIPGQHYAFGDSANFNYVSYGPYGYFGGGVYGNYLTNGEGTTDENGQVVIPLPADLLTEADAGSRRVNVEATVSDLAEFPVTSKTSVVFHGADTYVGIRPADYSVSVGQEAAVDLITVDWDGEPVPDQTVAVTFYQREWESERTTQDGQYYTEWTPVDTEIAHDSVTTDDQGKASASFMPEAGGAYIAVATVTDAGGRSLTSSTGIYVMDENYTGWRSAPREYTMELIPDQQSYQVGDTARILVQSPFPNPVTAWLAIERGNLVDQKLVQVSSSDVLEIPITADMAPNVYLSLAAVKPVEPDNEERPFADIRFGITELQVDPDRLALNLTITPQETEYEPGETAVFDIQVTDYSGAPTQAELSLALVDLAVLTLKDDNAPDILDYFYSPQALYSQTGSGLLVSGEGLDIEEPLDFAGGRGGGGGEDSQSALGKLPGDEDETRKDFPDTAYWEAKIVTDASGHATVEVALPDTTTTWRMHGKAVTNDSLVDQTDADIVTSLPLIVRPVTPRFFTVGDKIEIGAIVNNNTNQDLEVTVSLDAEGFEESSVAEQVITVAGNGRSLVRWPVTVADVEFADLTFRAEAGDYRDATKPSFGVGPEKLIPVYRYDAPDTVGTSGVIEEAGRRVEAALLPDNIDARRGSMDMQISASLAAALIDALDAQNLDYDPTCAGSVVDRLLPNVATARAITELDLDQADLLDRLDPAIVNDIGKLEAWQKQNGSWSWCQSSDSSPWLSAYILLALTKAEEAGYGVGQETLSSGSRYLYGKLQNPARLDNASAANRQAFFLYVLAENGEDVVADVDALFEAQRGLLDPYAKALLLLAYEANGASSDNQKTLLTDLNESVILSATGAHWEDASPDWDNLSSDIRGTAMVIDALTHTQPDALFAPQAVNWLMVARQASRWPSSHETAWSIFALTDWLVQTQELEAAYDWQLNVNTQPAADGSFSQANITDSVWESIPMNELVVGDVNFFDFERGSGNGRLYYNMHLNAYLPAESVAATSRGFTVERAYYDAACDPESETCLPIDSIAPGQQVRVQLTVIVPNNAVYALVTDPIPAGAEAIDPSLNTTSATLSSSTERTDRSSPWGWWGWWYFNRTEFRDQEVRFYADYLPAGTYQYTYYLQANIPGEYQVMPAQARQTYFPEVFGRSDGMKFSITE